MSQGEKIGHYEVGKALGSGSFSSVRECTDTNDGQKYAMKILDKNELKKEDMGPQLNREIAVMLKMSHPNVCTMKECFQTTDKVYIILELVAGGDLFDRISSAKRLDEETARNYFQQLILGLRYCHANGIAHRDLKPENLLVSPDNVLKLSDFGFANIQKTDDAGQVAPGNMLQTVCGTPSYVAPEVLIGSGYNGFHADMWSCGVILYVMLAGALPFADKVMGKLFQKITSGQYKEPEHFSEGAKVLIKKMLTVKTDQRATVEDVLKDEWFRVNFNDAWLETPPTGEAASKPAAGKAAAKPTARPSSGAKAPAKTSKPAAKK